MLRASGYLVFFLLLSACTSSDQEPEMVVAPAPDRATTVHLSGGAVKPEIIFPYEDIIWGFTFLPDNRILATDKRGKVLLINPEDGTSQEIKGVPPVKFAGQGGLLDIILHPEFSQNRYVYLSWSQADANDQASTAIGRGQLNMDENQLENFTVLYSAGNKSHTQHHYGSRMVWGPTDGHLYFTIGDRGNRDVNPQDITRDGGKVYRITEDGGIPSGNPFVGQAGAKEAIFSFGHRNPQGLAVHPETGEIWETEHGPRGGDEINIIQAGKNYGWPVVTYGINYDGSQITEEVKREGMESPLHYWVPSIAPSGTVFITGDRYPGWEGDLLVGSLAFSRLQHVQLDGKIVTGEQKLLNHYGRLRDVRMGPDDYIYVSVEGHGIARVVIE